MSPNEAQLRAALSEGEGEPVDASSLIAKAIVVRAQRRRRVNSAIAGAGIVAVVGLGIGALFASSSGEEGGGSSGGSNGSAALSTTDRAAAAAGTVVPGQASSAVASSGTSTFGSSTSSAAAELAASLRCVPTVYDLHGSEARPALFRVPPVAMKVCVYPHNGASLERSAVLDGASVRTIATALQAGTPTRSSAVRCTANAASVGKRLILRPVYVRSGKVVADTALTVDIGCGVSTISNGGAPAYLAQLPVPLLELATTGSTSSITPPGRMTGSPIRS